MQAVRYKRGAGIEFTSNATIRTPKANQVLIEVKAASINPVDYKLPAFLLHGKGVGLDVAGVVLSVGKEVTAFTEGDFIFGNCRGSLAQKAICNANAIALIPSGLSFIEAAAMPTTYLTGYQALTQYRLQSGARILVIGASGGCGTAGLQLSRLIGASEIVGVCSKQNETLALNVGATAVVDYKTQDVLDIYGPGYFDFVYDAASSSGGGESYQGVSRKLLKEPQPKDGIGMYVGLNGTPLQWARALLRLESRSNRLIMTQHSKIDLEAIIELMRPKSEDAEWQFKPVVDRVLPFDAESVEFGFKHLKSRRATGKIVFEH